MSAMIRCLAVVLLVPSFSAVALGQAVQNGGVPPALGQWGDNVLVTSVLTRGQSFETLFSNSVLVSDMVAQWRANFLMSPPAVTDAQEIKSALDILVRTFGADRRIDWTAQEVLVGKWTDLPGGTVNKNRIRAAFEILKADGVMCLSFLNRSQDEEAPQELVTAMVNVLENPVLSSLTHMDLYTTSANEDQYSEADMDLLIYAMDVVQLIRTEAPDRNTLTASLGTSGVSSMGTSGMSAMGTTSIGLCCNRTTRTCVDGGVTGKCSTCTGGLCCLGSSWCP